jgi:hypothetical protein
LRGEPVRRDEVLVDKNWQRLTMPRGTRRGNMSTSARGGQIYDGFRAIVARCSAD